MADKETLDLHALMVHAWDGEEVREEVVAVNDGVPVMGARTVHVCDEWIADAVNGRVMAPQAVALAVNATGQMLGDHERKACEGWGQELRNAAIAGDIAARDPITWLPLAGMPDDWGWMISVADLDSFALSRGMGWTFTEIIAAVKEEMDSHHQFLLRVRGPTGSAQPDAAISSSETPRQRGARLLQWHEEECAFKQHGAVQRVAEREAKRTGKKINRPYVGGQIRLARQEQAGSQREENVARAASPTANNPFGVTKVVDGKRQS